MKKILIGTILGLALYPVLSDLAELVDDRYDTSYWIKIGVPSYGLSLGLTGRCTDYVRSNGISNRVYFRCGKLNIMISNLIYKDNT